MLTIANPLADLIEIVKELAEMPADDCYYCVAPKSTYNNRHHFSCLINRAREILETLEK